MTDKKTHPILRKTKRFTLFLIIILLVVWGITELLRKPYEGSSGIRYGSAYSEIRKTDIDFHIWYPALSGGRSVKVGGNGVFHGTFGGRNATAKKGRFPTILMSHGAGGNAGQFAWIASMLAESGFVVVLPNHPGTTSGNASAKSAVRVWERPADIYSVIDEIINNADDYPYIDSSRLGVLGFSAGGYTAMAVSGARVNPDLLTRFCDDGGREMSDCAFLAHFGIDLHKMDLAPAAQDLHDERISVAVVVDPGIVETLTEESLTSIDIPMLVINLGEESKVPQGVYAKPAATKISTSTYKNVLSANHFSFLAECTERGAQILKDEGEPDPLCHDEARTRSDIHSELTALITDYLNQELAK